MDETDLDTMALTDHVEKERDKWRDPVICLTSLRKCLIEALKIHTLYCRVGYLFLSKPVSYAWLATSYCRRLLMHIYTCSTVTEPAKNLAWKLYSVS